MHLTHKAGVSLFTLVALVLCAVELWVVTSPAFPSHASVFGLIVTADLLLGIPLLFYGLVARPYRLSPIAVVPSFLVALGVAWAILPPSGRRYLDITLALVPLLELAALGVVVWKARAFYARYRQARQQQVYFLDRLEAAIRATFGTNLAVKLLTVEFALIFLSIFGWFMRFWVGDARDRVFTYHRKSLYPTIFLVFLLLMIFETIGLHLLIQHWSPMVAWILTGVSIYGIFWMIGDYNAIRLHPIVLAGDSLHLRSGFRWSVNLRVAEIADVQTPKRTNPKSRDYLTFARAGETRLVLVLKQPVRVSGLFGLDKNVSRIGVYVDDLGEFRAELDRRRHMDLLA
jgi:hypothetical protein